MLVLLVDDDSDFLIYLDEILRSNFEGIEVKTALNGNHALHMCEREKFDIISTDYRMPAMNGLEFVEALRSGNTLNADTKIIFLSGFLSEFFEKAQGVEDLFFLEKPFDQTRYLRIVSLATNHQAKQHRQSS